MKEKKAVVIAVNIIVIVSWMAMMLLLVRKEGLLRSRGVEGNFRELIPQDIEIDSWKSIYISNQWAGYVHTTMGPYHERERKGYLINAASYLHFRMFEQMKDIEINSVQVLDTAFRILKFEARISGMTNVMVTGKRLADHLLVEILYGKTKYRRVFEAVEDLFLENSILSIYRGKGLKVGDAYTLNLFNPLTMTAEPTHVEVVGKKDDHLLLETKFAGLSTKTWINSNGHVVREETTNGWLMVQETKQEIEQHISENAGKGVDILTDAAVIPRRKLEDPRNVTFLRLAVTGLDFRDFPFDGQRQRLLNRKEGIVEIRALRPDNKDPLILPYEGKELEAYMKPTIWIQSRDTKIMTKALEIIGDETDSWLASRMLGKWVYENIEKSLNVGIPVATSVLVNRAGDCNEHTVLFVGLARACGIPADICAGLVYIGDGFYYHAWPKVYVGQWIHLDPTFGQEVADATHFELVSGDFSAQAKLAMTLGKIGIEILDAHGGDSS